MDVDAQPLYPFEFHQGDALAFSPRGFAVIHASPPCQAHTPLASLNRARGIPVGPDLISATRERLIRSGAPWVIENVATRSAGLRDPIILCGTMFDLRVFRHRAFESSAPLLAPGHWPHLDVATPNGRLPTTERPMMTVTGRNGHHSRAWVVAAANALGAPHLAGDLNATCEAIPPAYTEWVGRQLMSKLPRC